MLSFLIAADYMSASGFPPRAKREARRKCQRAGLTPGAVVEIVEVVLNDDPKDSKPRPS
jgi:hypothetical protein